MGDVVPFRPATKTLETAVKEFLGAEDRAARAAARGRLIAAFCRDVFEDDDRRPCDT